MLEVRQAFTKLTTEPGPDIAPHPDRQIVVLERKAWADLIPTLRPGDIVILDNLGSHKQGHPRCHQSAGARLWFLPKYLPDLNPIEQSGKGDIVFGEDPENQSGKDRQRS